DRALRRRADRGGRRGACAEHRRARPRAGRLPARAPQAARGPRPARRPAAPPHRPRQAPSLILDLSTGHATLACTGSRSGPADKSKINEEGRARPRRTLPVLRRFPGPGSPVPSPRSKALGVLLLRLLLLGGVALDRAEQQLGDVDDLQGLLRLALGLL